MLNQTEKLYFLRWFPEGWHFINKNERHDQQAGPVVEAGTEGDWDLVQDRVWKMFSFYQFVFGYNAFLTPFYSGQWISPYLSPVPGITFPFLI